MTALAALPLWPARMPARIAAAYCGVLDRDGVPDPKRFERHVKKGLYPRPYRRPGEEKAWLKTELDLALERIPEEKQHPKSKPAPEEEDEFE